MKKILLLVVLFISVITIADAQSSSSFSYYKDITIQESQIPGSGSLTDFPVLISVTDNSLRTTANGGRLQNSNGWDILFTNNTGSTDLNFQIESYTATNGNLIAWVRVPTLSATTNTVIRIYYGKSGVSSNPSSNSTWTSDYRAVYHFNNTISDASSNANNGTNTGSTNVSSAKIGQGRGFNGSNQFITVPNSSSLNITGNTITISAWANIVAVNADAPIAVKGVDMNQEQYMLGVDVADSPRRYNMRTTTNTGHYRYNVTNISLNNWAYVVFVYNGALGSNPRMRMYVNGVETSAQNASGNINSTTGSLMIGKRPGSDNRYLQGNIDELRISNIAKSTDWIATEYNNQNNPASFYTIGSEQAIFTQIVNLDLTAVFDTEIWTKKVNDNYGTCNKIYLNRDNNQRGLIQFNLSAIPSNANIISASLRLVKNGGKNGAFNLSVHRLTNSWTEGTGGCADGTTGNATWNNRTTGTAWGTSGGDFVSTSEATISVAGNGVYTWGITSLVQNWVNGTHANNGLLVKFVTEGGSDEEKDFASREHNTASERPRLILSYQIPLGATLATTNVSCFGGNNGALTTNVTGGTTPYTYNWGSGITTATEQ